MPAVLYASSAVTCGVDHVHTAFNIFFACSSVNSGGVGDFLNIASTFPSCSVSLSLTRSAGRF